MKDFMKLMEKKGSKVDPERKRAKMSMLESLKSEMSGMMANDLKGLKKVTVASPDKEGLAEGLAKATEMLGVDSEDSDESEESSEDEAMTVDELEAKIKELEDLKAKKMRE